MEVYRIIEPRSSTHPSFHSKWVFAAISNSETFGHSGLVSCVGLASYDQNISLAILNNLLLSDQLNEHRMRTIISAIIMDIDRMKI